jgi:hypothetical protein
VIDRSLAVGEPVLVATDAHTTGRLCARLGDRADRVHFVDMRVVGRNPARLIPLWRSFIDAHAPEPVRGVGEPVWPGRSADELAECARHEVLVNVAFAGSPDFRLTCPYDVAALDAGTVMSAERSHPLISEVGAPRLSPAFTFRAASAGSSGGRSAEPYPEPATAPKDRGFERADLPTLRPWGRPSDDHGRAIGASNDLDVVDERRHDVHAAIPVRIAAAESPGSVVDQADHEIGVHLALDRDVTGTAVAICVLDRVGTGLVHRDDEVRSFLGGTPRARSPRSTFARRSPPPGGRRPSGRPEDPTCPCVP